MNNRFYIYSGEGKIFSCKNTVLSGFKSEFGGELFDKIYVECIVDGVAATLETSAEYLSTDVVDGVGRICFSCLFDGGVGCEVSAVGFKTGSGVKINRAEFSSPVSVSGECEIFAEAYFSVSGEGIRLGDQPEGLFELIAGRSVGVITARPKDKSIGRGIVYPVELLRGEGKLSLCVSTDKENCEEIAFFAKNKHVFSVEAQAFEAVGEVRTPINRELGEVEYGAEIIDISGSTITLSATAVRPVGVEIDGGRPIVRYYGEMGKLVQSESGRYVVRLIEGKVEICDRDLGYLPIHAFSEELAKGYSDLAFMGEKLLLLSSSLFEYDVASGTLTERISAEGYDKIFASPRFAVMVGNSGLVAFNAGYSLIYSKNASGFIFNFDSLTDTVLGIKSGECLHVSLGGTPKEKSVFLTAVSPYAVGGRFGTVVWAEGGGIRCCDVFKGECRQGVAGKSVKFYCGGRVVCRVNGGKKEFLTDDGRVLFSLGGECEWTESGVFSDKKFFEFIRFVQHFELMGESVEGEYSIFKEVPFFAQKTHKITYEGTV